MIFDCLVEVSLLTKCASFEDFTHRFVISTFLLFGDFGVYGGLSVGSHLLLL